MNAVGQREIADPTRESALVHSLFPNGRGISICHVVSAEQWAGAEAQIAMLLSHLSSNTALSVCAIVLGEGKLLKELRNSSIETFFIPRSRARFLASFQMASRFLRTKKVDVLHAHKTKEGLLAVLLAKRFRIPCLLRTQHGMPEAYTGKDVVVFQLEKMATRYISRTVCVSADLKQRLSSKIPAEKLIVIHNAIDPRKVRSSFTTEQAKERLGIKPTATVVGIVGRLEHVKRVDLFLDVARCLSRDLPTACFVIAGTGREEETLRSSLRGSGHLEQQVHFLGERSDIYDVLRAMDLLLITSDHEGLPTVLLEAMSLGVPVVARNVGGIGEVIRDNVSGRLLTSAAPATIAGACMESLTPGLSRQGMIKAGMEAVQHYFVEHNALSYLHLYQDLCSPGRTI